jgi:CheY-like chemotaxis protein
MYKKRALILEDDKIVAFLEKEILEGEGFEVEVVGDGAEGLEKVRRNVYDLIISDIMMPRMRGDEFYLAVRKLGRGLEKKIIFVSGSVDDFIKSTGDKFLYKPFTSKLLAQTVRDVFAN